MSLYNASIRKLIDQIMVKLKINGSVEDQQLGCVRAYSKTSRRALHIVFNVTVITLIIKQIEAFPMKPHAWAYLHFAISAKFLCGIA